MSQITGGSGHLGYRVIVEALKAGYKVRAAVRTLEKAEIIKAAASVQPYLSTLEFVVVPNILADGAYDEASKGVSYILHSASPIAFDVSGNFERPLP